MSTETAVCGKCGSEILMGFCNCDGLTPRDKQAGKSKEAKAEFDEKRKRDKDPRWKIRRRRKPKRR